MKSFKTALKNSCRCHLKAMIALFSVFFLVSCFPDDNKQQTGSIEQQMQIQQTTAVSYARMFQQYAALSQQYLMKDVWEGDGTITLPADGLIGSQTFANLYNIDKSSEFLESAYCDMGANQYHISWFKGNAASAGSDTGAALIEPIDLKGLGKTGYGNIMKVMAREMSPRSYGSYENGQLKLGDGSTQALTCAAIAYIPRGIPVIISTVKNNASEQTREYYVYSSEVCTGENEMGVKRTRVKMKQVFDENGRPVGDPQQISAQPEIIVDACQTNPGTPAISIAAQQADVVDFASAGLGGTIQANCFEATKVNAEGQPIDENGNVTQNPITFSNCDGSHYNFDPEDLPPGQQLNCEGGLLPHNPADPRMQRTVPCSGSGWSGNATYRREIYSCEVVDMSTGQGTGVFYEEARAWTNGSIYCTRPEETFFACPYSGGTLRYDRTNVIDEFVSGTFNPAPPTNPAWSYASGTCDLNVENCNVRYLGQDNVADASMPGSLERRSATNPHNIPGSQINPINTVCGSGAVCTEVRDGLACPVDNMTGSRTEKRTYTCTGSNTGAWSHPAAPAPWLETGNTCNCTVWSQTDFGVECTATSFTPACPTGTESGYGNNCPTVGATCYNADPVGMQGSFCPEGQSPFERQTLQCQNYTDAASCGCSEQEEIRISGQPGAPTCGAGQAGSITQKRVRSCPSGTWGDWETVSNSCGCSGPYTQDISGGSCPAGQTGAITIHQAKDPVTCAWNTVSTTNTCAACGTSQREWQLVSGASECVRPGSGNRWCNNPVTYPYAMCPFGLYGGNGGACSTLNQRCNTQAEYLDAGSCTTCTSPYITTIHSYIYEIYECRDTVGETCCTPYEEPVSEDPNTCGPGQSGESSRTYNYYGCDTVNNTQLPPELRVETSGTCTPDACAPKWRMIGGGPDTLCGELAPSGVPDCGITIGDDCTAGSSCVEVQGPGPGSASCVPSSWEVTRYTCAVPNGCGSTPECPPGESYSYYWGVESGGVVCGPPPSPTCGTAVCNEANFGTTCVQEREPAMSGPGCNPATHVYSKECKRQCQ